MEVGEEQTSKQEIGKSGREAAPGNCISRGSNKKRSPKRQELVGNLGQSVMSLSDMKANENGLY
jgi:hypothetical protein